MKNFEEKEDENKIRKSDIHSKIELYIFINKFFNQTLHLIFIFDLLKFLIMI
jgi:hypothetical protein